MISLLFVFLLLPFLIAIEADTKTKHQVFYDSSWLKYIRRRIKLNKNFLAAVTGPTGSGKSYVCLAVAETDPNFTIEQVVFHPKELMELITSGKLKPGSIIIFEEVGVNLSSRNWQGTINKMLSFLFQTFRHKNYILLMNSPSFDFIDSQTRRLFHSEWRTDGINTAQEVVKLKPLCIQYNAQVRKFYFKYLRVRKQGVQGTIPVRSWSIPKPSAQLIAAYEAKKTAFTNQLNKQIIEEIEEATGNAKGEKKQQLSLQQQRVYELLKAKKRVEDITIALNIKSRTVYQSMKSIEMKGYALKPIYDEGGRVLHYDVA